MKRLHAIQRGFAAITAVFLLVVLAALGAFMLTFSNTQQLTSAQDVQGSRAYWAARSGLEWGIANISAQAAGSAACPAPQVLPGGGATFDGGFTVNVTCASRDYTEAGATVRIFRINAVATAGGVPGDLAYVERSLSASMEQ